jgi:excisionase family DNA binding protein
MPISKTQLFLSAAHSPPTHASAVIAGSAKLAYTVPEAVSASGIGRTRLYELIRNQRLEARKMGRRMLIPADALRALLASLPAAQNSHM